MKRFLSCAVLAALFVVPLTAHAKARMSWEGLRFRTTQSDAPAIPQWALGTPGSVGFLDSLVFRKGAATGTLVDTTIAYPLDMFKNPPSYGEPHGLVRAQKLLGMQALPGGTDSLVTDTTDTTPWIQIVIRQDTLSHSFSGTSGLDSVMVGAQVSYDGANWVSVSGTNTRIAYANPTGISGQDGLAIPMVTLTEYSPGADAVSFPYFFCIPNADVGGAPILNRTLCNTSAKYVRFIIGVNDGSGQFRGDIGYWSE